MFLLKVKVVQPTDFKIRNFYFEGEQSLFPVCGTFFRHYCVASSSQLFADQLVFTDNNGNLLVATKFSWLHYISLVTSGCQMVSRAVWLGHYLESTESHASLLDSYVLYDFIIGTAGGARGKVWGITSIFSNLPVGIMTVFNFKTWAIKIKTNKLKLSSYKTDCKCQCL